jgi:alkanesulfonate monooxygenase SsuD/methylene tetrahydromethanopterin reductase-like flavin-dependent oxidoreductase (luciferase family)
MKASFVCTTTYEDPEPHNYLGEGPVPAALFKPEVGTRSFDHFLEYAQMADDLGYDWVSVSEHHYGPLILTPSVATMAGALSQVVKRARLALLGPLAPVSNPVRTAEEIAMLDHLTHGRLIVLPLRGTPNEYTAYGPIDVPTSKSMTHEATQLIQKALSSPQPFSWESEHFRYPSVSVWPQPVQRPFPPMYYSGNSPDSAIFAAQNRLGLCFSFHTPNVVARTVASYRAEAAKAGWTPTQDQIVYRGFIVLTETPEEAARLEASFLSARMVAGIQANKRIQLGSDGVSAQTLPEDWARGAQQPDVPPVPDKGPVGFGLGGLLFAGTPDVVVERIRDFYAQTGVGILDLVFSTGLTPPDAIRRGVELFGREVLPRIRELGDSGSETPAVAADSVQGTSQAR